MVWESKKKIDFFSLYGLILNQVYQQLPMLLNIPLKGAAGIWSHSTAVVIICSQATEEAQVCWLLDLFCELKLPSKPKNPLKATGKKWKFGFLFQFLLGKWNVDV